MASPVLELVMTKAPGDKVTIGLARGARTVHVADLPDGEEAEEYIEQLADVLGQAGAVATSAGVYSPAPCRFVGYEEAGS